MFVLYIVLIIISQYSVLNVTSQTATCSRYESEKQIKGIEGLMTFKRYENQCSDNTTIVLTYDKCHVESIGLNVTKIRLIFPNLRTLYWFCKGFCYLEDSNIHVNVIGCREGKY